VWCNEYFQPLKRDSFPVHLPKDEEGNLLVNEEDRNRYGVTSQVANFFDLFSVIFTTSGIYRADPDGRRRKAGLHRTFEMLTKGEF
jgi:hypothetical protein